MKRSYAVGLSFGSVSGIVTTLGLLVGLYSSTHSLLAIIGGIFSIAVADAFSDAIGIHFTMEGLRESSRNVWEATFMTFFTKLFFAMLFIMPFIFLPIALAVLVSVIWGIFVAALFTLFVYTGKKRIVIAVLHGMMALVVAVLSYGVGNLVGSIFF